jgi:hypothetical protein
MNNQKSVWCIYTNYGYGWECESEYDKDDYKNPMSTAYSDANEYRKLGCQVEVRRKRVPMV